MGIAENLHDSCLTLLHDGRVVVHLELERVIRRKRAIFSSAEQALALARLATQRYNTPPPQVIAVVRHAVEPATGAILEQLPRAFPDARVLEVEHLDAHAGLALAAGFKDAEVIALDGGGDRRIHWGTPNGLVARVRDGQLLPSRLLTSDELGLDGRAWALLSLALFDDVHAAGKTMGLAGHGETDPHLRTQMQQFGAQALHWRYEDVSGRALTRDMNLHDFAAQGTAALALQDVFTAAMKDLVTSIDCGKRPLILTGGCALNVTTNAALAEKLAARGGTVWVPPCPGDEGISLGAALVAAAALGEQIDVVFPYLGVGEEGLPSAKAIRSAARLLADGKVLVTAIGRSEVGPRALGNRSFLALPSVRNRILISEKIKRREAFRPVAPAIKANHLDTYLKEPIDSPYMSFAGRATDKLRDIGPGVVHVDGTARHQSVDQQSHPTLYALLDELERCGVAPVLMNTSLNTAGEPICRDAHDALATALQTGADAILTHDGLDELR